MLQCNLVVNSAALEYGAVQTATGARRKTRPLKLHQHLPADVALEVVALKLDLVGP